MKAIPFLAAALFLNAAFAAASEAPQPWKWETVEGRSLSLSGEHGLVWTLHFDPALPHFYFDPLRTGDGRDVAWASPPDHLWHYGLWFSWKHINDVNYWEIAKDSAYPAGRTLIEKIEVLETSQKACRVRLSMSLRPAADADPIARETVLLRVETPRAGGAYAIDWLQQTEALTGLELASPRGYGGLSIRAAEAWKDPAFVSSNGPCDFGSESILITPPATWLDVTATANGKPVGIALFDHPSNPRHPTPWFLVNRTLTAGPNTPAGSRPPWPFIYANAAITPGTPLQLVKGQTLTLFYRVLPHAGLAAGQAEAESSGFRALTPDLNP